MALVRPPTPPDAFTTTTTSSTNHGYFLALRLDEIVRAADEQATCRLWKLFHSCVNEVEQGKRLENLSWRTWSREQTLHSRQHYLRVPLLDDEADCQSPPLTEDDDGDSTSGSDDSSAESQSRQRQHTIDLAPVQSIPPSVPELPELPVSVSVARVVVATAAQSTDSQQHTPLLTTPRRSTPPPPQPRQPRQHHHHHHKCSASHPATGARPRMVANSHRHYSHSLPHAAAAAAAAATPASPPIGQLIQRVIFNQSAVMMAMTHDDPQHHPNLDLSDTMATLHTATLPTLTRAATVAAAAPAPTAPSVSTSHRDHPTLTITESTPLPSVEPTPLPTPKPTGLSPFPYTVPAPLGCSDAQPEASDSHSVPVTTRRTLNPPTGHPSHHRMFYLQYHSPDGSSSGGSHNSRSHNTPPTPGLPPSQYPPQPPQLSPAHVEAHRVRSNAAGALRMSARRGKESTRHGPRNTSARMATRVVGTRRGAKSDRSIANTLVPGSASSGASRKAVTAPRRAETVEQRGVDEKGGRTGVIGPDLHMQQRHQMQQVVCHTPQRQVQQPSRSEPGTSTLTTADPAAVAGNTNASSSQTAFQDIRVKNVTGPTMKLITPGLFDGDKVKPEVLDQRVDAALKAALNGATGNHRRRIKLVSSSEHESDYDDDDGESSWSDDESNEDERQQHQGPAHRSSLSARKDGQMTESDDDSDDNGGDDGRDGPLARAAKEAERQRNMFAKLPRESYADLRRKGIGAGPSNLTLLLNPPPEMFPQEHPYRTLSRQSRSVGDIAHHRQDGFGYGSQMQQPQQAQGQYHQQYQYQQQQQQRYGRLPQQYAQMQRQKSQPSYGNDQCPPQYTVAPPPQPRQRPVTPVQAQVQHQQQLAQHPSAKPPTRERIGGFGGFGFTAMHQDDSKAPKQPAPAPAPAAQRPQKVVVAPPPSTVAARRASTGASRVASTPPVLLRSLSKSSVLNPIIQQVTASSFKDGLPVTSANSHEASPSPKMATISPRGGRPGNRLSARPDDVELSDSEDDGPEQTIPPPNSMLKSPMSPTLKSGENPQREAFMSEKTKSTAAYSATAVTTEGRMLVDGQDPEAPIEYPGSLVLLRAPPSTPSRGTETRVNGEHLPRSPTVRAERPRTYGASKNSHRSPPPPYPEHPQAGGPGTSEPSSSNGPMYPQPIEMPYPYNLPFPTHMLSPRTTRLKMLSSEMPPDLRNDLLWERKTNRVHAVYRPMAGLRPLAHTAGSGDEGAPKELTEEERATVAGEEARRRAMRNRTWVGVFPRPTAW